MNLLQTILDAQNGSAVREVAEGFGLTQNQAQSAIQSLLPALAGGLKRNASSSSGLESLVGALRGGEHDQYLENPSRLRQPEIAAEGNAILGHVLGSKDVSRAAAGRAAEKTGLDYGLLKRMLPVVATMAMGALSKQQNENPRLQTADSEAQKDLVGMLTPMLDADGDGSAVDDLFNMARKFF